MGQLEREERAGSRKVRLEESNNFRWYIVLARTVAKRRKLRIDNEE